MLKVFLFTMKFMFLYPLPSVMPIRLWRYYLWKRINTRWSEHSTKTLYLYFIFNIIRTSWCTQKILDTHFWKTCSWEWKARTLHFRVYTCISRRQSEKNTNKKEHILLTNYTDYAPNNFALSTNLGNSRPHANAFTTAFATFHRSYFCVFVPDKYLDLNL